jgi:hypothetical protein
MRKAWIAQSLPITTVTSNKSTMQVVFSLENEADQPA